ncbi:hypothetical protein KSS87_011954 [Heliosperma pusillum]|nr:hypothetical protein KSS87_011954 [Heliosperma pusillum]
MADFFPLISSLFFLWMAFDLFFLGMFPSLPWDLVGVEVLFATRKSTSFREEQDKGFRKVDPDRWEFANEGFLGGQKHLLKTIKRRRNVAQSTQHQGGSCVELGQYGLDGEIDRLKRDRTVLMTEIVKLRQQQQFSRNQLVAMETRLQSTEKKHQHMMTFLAKALVNPTFVQNLIQQNQEDLKSLKDVKIGGKRRLTSSPSVENLEEIVSIPVLEGMTSVESDIETLFSASNGTNIGNEAAIDWEEVLLAEDDQGLQGDEQEVDVPVENLEPESLDWGEDLQDLIDQLGFLGSES